VSGGFVEGGGGAAVGPAAAEGDVDAEAEFAGFGLGVVDVVEHVGADEGLVDEAFGGVVEDLGVDEGELGAADSVGLHLLELAKDLGLFYGGTEPPPADHGPGVSGGILEALFEGWCWVDCGRG
jgi:hypothetical protein